MKKLFSAQELEELRLYDAEIDAEELTYEDFEQDDFIDEMNDPAGAKKRAKKREAYHRRKEEMIQNGTYEDLVKGWSEYYHSHKEQIKAKQKTWYEENKERIKAQQKAYRIRTGRQMTPEQKAAKKAASAERAKAYQKAYRERKKMEREAAKAAG